MIPLHQPPAVLQNHVHRLHQIVRRQTAVGFTTGHAAPCGVEPDAQFRRRLELPVNKALGAGFGEYIVMVHAGGAAVTQQLPHAGETAVIDAVRIQSPPDFIEGHQPGKQLHFLDLGQVAGEGLIEVVMGVDETGIDKAALGVQHPVCRLFLRSHIGDDAVLD